MISREKIRKYFRFSKKGPIWLIVIGLLLIPLFGVGLLLLLIGMIKLFGARKLPTDSEIDQQINADLADLERRALSKTGIEPADVVAEPVVVTGLHLENIGDAEFYIKTGKDDVVRFTPLGVTIINFTQHQLVAYQCAFDLITGNPLNESTDEYFYQDVVSVSTQSESKSLYLDRSSKRQLKNSPLAKIIKDDAIQFNAAETFVLTTSGGTKVEVVLSDPQLIEAVGGGKIPVHLADKAITSVRRMLREKKAAHAPA
jgi:hypothetical protein